jgi:hypothetical protein
MTLRKKWAKLKPVTRRGNDMEIPTIAIKPSANSPLAEVNTGFFPLKLQRSARADELDLHSFGFMVGVDGGWTDADLAQFRHFLKLRHFTPTEEELSSSLARAKEKYRQGNSHVFLCHAHPCCESCNFDGSKTPLTATSDSVDLRVSTTGCQGHCKHAPVLSLRINTGSQMFGRVVNENDWLSVLGFAKNAARANSLLVNPGAAEEFFFDPAHESQHDKSDAHLKGLRFLLGRFRGEGHCSMSSQTFHKEVVGTVEAGGRFIALRMAASYPLANGRKDTHRALVVVGMRAHSNCITGRAYNDGGRTCEYEVEQDGDAGEGFINYYQIFMRKISYL